MPLFPDERCPFKATGRFCEKIAEAAMKLSSDLRRSPEKYFCTNGTSRGAVHDIEHLCKRHAESRTMIDAGNDQEVESSN